MITFDDFKRSLGQPSPPASAGLAVQALWHQAKGDWATAHACAQACEGTHEDRIGAWVHAHLHRAEGDLANAGYWYRRAGKPAASSTLPQEWEGIARALLG